jgi:hypothetical protein
MNNEMELAAGVLTILAALIIGGSIVGLVIYFEIIRLQVPGLKAVSYQLPLL